MSGTRLAPSANKFHAGAGADGKHYWLTPPKLYAELDAQYSFDFDPCPYPKPDDFDGLTAEWGASSYVNPPFGSIMHDGKRKGMTAWVRKALAEHAKGKRVVMVYPLDKWILMLIKAGAKIENLGDVRWHSTEDRQPGKGTGRHIAKIVLEPSAPLTQPGTGSTGRLEAVFDSRTNMTRYPAAGSTGGAPTRDELAKIVYAAHSHPPNQAIMRRAYERCVTCEPIIDAILARWPAASRVPSESPIEVRAAVREALTKLARSAGRMTWGPFAVIKHIEEFRDREYPALSSESTLFSPHQKCSTCAHSQHQHQQLGGMYWTACTSPECACEGFTIAKHFGVGVPSESPDTEQKR